MQGDYNADLLENVYSMKSWRGGFTWAIQFYILVVVAIAAWTSSPLYL